MIKELIDLVVKLTKLFEESSDFENYDVNFPKFGVFNDFYINWRNEKDEGTEYRLCGS